MLITRASENETNLKPGDLIAGRFRIVEMIGTGGFSVVYRAHQEGMNRFVALKVLKPRASTDERIVERFRREALFASQLSHPNTITLFDYGQTDDGLCYIAMEHLVGHDLSEEIRDREPMDLQRVWWILVQICRSLSEAHRIGLIHRDLKPENIFLLERNGRDHVKVLDFGVSKALNGFDKDDVTSLAPLTLEGTVFGTPLYMAPEQAMAEDLTPAVDVYALGQMAYEMITGRAAYDQDLSPMDVMLHQINDPPLRLPGHLEQTPFSALIEACTQKEPYERISDAGKLQERLMGEEFLPYMPPSEIPPSLRIAGAHLNQLEAIRTAQEETAKTEEVYRWELTVLEETFKEVQASSQIRLVVIRGRPGVGRSNLLRAFMKRHQGKTGVRVLHRRSRDDGRGHLSGLEAELAAAAGLSLKGEGIKELHRLMGQYLADPDQVTMEEMKAVRLSSNPLEQLSNQRDQFFARLVKPFRRSARLGTLVWGIEDLENVDPLTMAFLDRFIREMRVHPSPILLVLTVSPELLMERPGLGRYTEGILEASSSYARHLEILEPGTLKKGDLARGVSDHELRSLADVPSDLDVNGSFSGQLSGARMKAFFGEMLGELEGEDIAQWAAEADGMSRADEGSREDEDIDGSVEKKSVSVSSELEDLELEGAESDRGEAEGSERASESSSPSKGAAIFADAIARAPEESYKKAPKNTERLELFTSVETASLKTSSSDVEKAFDSVLGVLAQLDERLISRDLWDFVYPRMLPFEMSRIIPVVLQFAERYGILHLTESRIAFTDPAYVQSLRDTFESLASAKESHKDLAACLHEYSPQPDRGALRLIVDHAVKGEDYSRAVGLLLGAAEKAAAEMDLDSAREYYLQFHSLIDELSTRAPTPAVAYDSYPEVWLEIGKVQGALGEFGAAEDALRRALRECQSDDFRLQATANKLLGDLAISQERFQDARGYFEVARDLYHKASLARPYVACLGEIGRCAVRLGYPRQAEGILLQAIDKAEKLQDKELAARHHRYMGEVMTRQARFLEAVDHLKVSMEVSEESNRHEEVLTALHEQGRANFAAGCYEESRGNYTRALALSSSEHLQLARSPHLGLARALAALGNLEQAEIHLVEAMSHYSTRNQPVQRARVQYHLGDLYLAMDRPGIAEEHYHHVFELGKNVGHRSLAIDALIRRAYALLDQQNEEACFAALSQAVGFAEEYEDVEARAVARAHIIYIQLMLHDFRTRGEAFSTLLQDTDERRVLPSHILADLFRVDLALARESWQEAASLLAKARLNAANLGDYGLFIPISRREYKISKVLGTLTDPHKGSGFALGALVPPEAMKRRD